MVELDGLRFHGLTDQRRHDRARGNQIVAAGYTLLRFAYLDLVEEPERVVAEIRTALNRTLSSSGRLAS